MLDDEHNDIFVHVDIKTKGIPFECIFQWNSMPVPEELHAIPLQTACMQLMFKFKIFSCRDHYVQSGMPWMSSC